ncbi:hypothetical protein [Serratia symbiotica]|uniref:hypothetical protein n=1 Tax=Serratia symbiotica TaxID=138074 RepID=UPI0030D46A54
MYALPERCPFRRLFYSQSDLFNKASKSFSKTDFALNLLLKKPDEWSVPTYISEGLKWLEAEIAQPELEIAEGQEEGG